MTIFRGAGGGGNITTDTELTAITVLSAAATASAASAGTSAISATASASAAAASAAVAATSASGGGTSATAAAASATNASNSASSASTSASNAAASAASIDPATLVKLTGNQTIAGIKTFSSTVVGNIDSATTLAAGADRTKLDAITGTNTGDETLATIKTKLGITTLSGSNTGDQTNISGNAATVTTNANLTGVVTSIGNATSLGSMTSAQLAAAITDETGTGSNVFATSPTLVTPALGTPSALVGTNITGTAASFNINGTVGATTPAAATVTALTATADSAFTSTGSVTVAKGTTAQRPATPVSGMFRFNTTTVAFEGYNGTAFASVGGGATGGGTDQVFVENGRTVTTNYTITAGKNAMSTGPVTVNSGVVVTVPSGSRYVVI